MLTLKKRIVRYHEIIEFRKEKKVAEIAKIYNLTYHTTWTIIKRGLPKTRLNTTGISEGLSHNEYHKFYRNLHRDKVKARKTVYSNLRNGNIKRKNCFCGKRKVEAHHEDYTKPLEIIWLCKFHHVEADRKLRERPVEKSLV